MLGANVWLLAARPKTWGASIAPVLIGAGLAINTGRFSLSTTLLILLSALLIQIGTNYCNDYCDFKKGADQNRVGPLRATQAGLVTPQEMKRATIITFSAALIIGIYLVYLGGIPILGIGVLSILFGALYTAGPYPLAYLGLGDLFVLIFFGPVAVMGTYLLNTGELSLSSVTLGLIPGLISVAILTVNNLRDFATDLVSNKRTIIVRWGEPFGRFQYAASLLLSTLLISFHRDALGAIGASCIFTLMLITSALLSVSLYSKSRAELIPFLQLTNVFLIASSLSIFLFLCAVNL